MHHVLLRVSRTPSYAKNPNERSYVSLSPSGTSLIRASITVVKEAERLIHQAIGGSHSAIPRACLVVARRGHVPRFCEYLHSAAKRRPPFNTIPSGSPSCAETAYLTYKPKDPMQSLPSRNYGGWNAQPLTYIVIIVNRLRTRKRENEAS